MNQIDNLNKIKKYLSRYQQLVKMNTANNEYDINIHSENIIIPILNIALKNQFYNLNEDTKNADSIDLLSTDKKVAVQVTSTYKIDKVKTTIEKLLKSEHSKTAKSLYIYILTEKQSSYSQASIDKIKGKFDFNAKKHILDASDIYAMLKNGNNFENIENVANFLELQFKDSQVKSGFSFQDLDTFREQYKDKCITNFSRLNFFGLSISNKPREIELYRLFVAPIFEMDDSSFSWDIIMKDQQVFNISDLQVHNTKLLNTEVITTKDIIDYQTRHVELFENFDIEFNKVYNPNENLVILGNPGAGKSSMIKYSICKILEEDYDVFDLSKVNIYKYLPLRIELHKFNKAKSASKISILKYLQNLLEEEYQTNITVENLDYILRYFSTLVFFDGLDEIFDIQERISVRNDIENFSKTFKESKIVVTSRFESYEEVSLNSKMFKRITVKNFNDTQVEQYVNNWYSLIEENETTRTKEVKNCIKQLVAVDAELKYNPLLLSLILILYRNELEIPTSKLKIYEGCTHTIVDTRDSNEKKLKIMLKISNKLSVFSSLAYWQFSKFGKSQNFGYNEVHNFIKSYLIEKNEFDDEHLAAEATTEFLDFAKTRSIYLENKFTHKTFLEYFTAYFIFSNLYSKPNNRELFQNILTDYIGLSSWAVVLELLICKIDDQQIDYEIIDGLINDQLELNKTDALLFFLQILKYIRNVSKDTLRSTFEFAIKSCFNTEKLKESKIFQGEAIFNHLTSLYSIDKYKALIDEVFEKLLKQNSINELNASVFAYQFSIVTEDSKLKTLLESANIANVHQLVFLLKHFDDLKNEKKYIEVMKEFIQFYGLNACSGIIKSWFNQKIFSGSEKFNWCLNYMFRKNKDLVKSYDTLVSNGINHTVLNKSSLKKSALMSLSPQEIVKLTQINKDNAKLKLFVGNLIKVYFPSLQSTLLQKDEKFYDQFFLRQKKK